MKSIELAHGYVALVDDEDYESLLKYKWWIAKRHHTTYACRYQRFGFYRYGNVMLHNQIMPPPEGLEIDHIDGNGLNNQKNNLRYCTRSENLRNRVKVSNNTSGYKGVSWHKQRKKWRAYYTMNNKQISLGLFDTPEEAAHAYDTAAREKYGDFAKTNF